LQADDRAGPCERDAVRADADDRDDPRMKTAHGAQETRSAGKQFVGRQFVGRDRGAANQIRNTAANAQQFALLRWMQQPRRKSGGMKRGPEPIAWPREVMARGR
jgi:hypothetical protein